MSISIELELPSYAEARRAEQLLQNRADVLRAAGIEIAGLDVRPVLGASRSVFALRIALQLLSDVAIGVAGNAAYDELKTVVSEMQAAKSDPPALTIRINNQPVVLERQPLVDAFGAAHAAPPHNRPS